MASAPLLTIITINYNNAEGLKKTINSVLTQTDVKKKDVEYLIIDGGSSDESVNIIKDFESRKKLPLKITKWVSEKDGGIYNAMNKGIKMASGTYLHMLNSGDYYYPDALAPVIAKLSSKKADFLLAGLSPVNNSTIYCTEVRYPAFLEHGSMSHQGLFYKRELHDKFGLYDEKYRFASDYDFELKALYKNDNFLVEGNPSVYFELGGVGGSDASEKEIIEIKRKNNLYPPASVKQAVKDFIKLLVPPVFSKLAKLVIK